MIEHAPRSAVGFDTPNIKWWILHTANPFWTKVVSEGSIFRITHHEFPPCPCLSGVPVRLETSSALRSCCEKLTLSDSSESSVTRITLTFSTNKPIIWPSRSHGPMSEARRGRSAREHGRSQVRCRSTLLGAFLTFFATQTAMVALSKLIHKQRQKVRTAKRFGSTISGYYWRHDNDKT